MKTCIKCGLIKSIGSFYKHARSKDGHLGKCIDCCKSDSIKYRKKRREYYLEYDKKRSSLPHRVELRREYEKKHPDVIKRIKEKWSNNNKIKIKIATQKYRRSNPEKVRAHSLAEYAANTGKIKKEPCVICGKTHVHAHHRDYNNPLSVIWLCPGCHKKVHAHVLKIPF